MKPFASLTLALISLSCATATPLAWSTFRLSDHRWGGITGDSALAGSRVWFDPLSTQYHANGNAAAGDYAPAGASGDSTRFRGPGSGFTTLIAAFGGTLRLDTRTDSSPGGGGAAEAIMERFSQPLSGGLGTEDAGANGHLDTGNGGESPMAESHRLFNNAPAIWNSTKGREGVTETASQDNVMLPACAEVPEPSTIALTVLGLGLLAWNRRSR